MNHEYLADTGVSVSRLAFGTMSFGGDADEEMSGLLYRRCREAGINHFDTADVYQKGRSEEILGRLVREERDQVVIASKGYFPVSDDVNARGASRRHLSRAAEASLKRLGTDRIDIYYIHRFDGAMGLEEALRGLEDLARAGKILYPAVSNFAAWQVEKALGIAALRGWGAVKCIQPMYNLVKRQSEVEILPMARAEGLAVFPYSPLGGGLLTGKYGRGRQPESGRLATNRMYGERYRDERNFEVAERFSELARSHGHEPAALAVAWVASHPAVTAPLIGARNLEQLEGSLAALEIEMTPELREEIAALSPAPPPATDRSEEGGASAMMSR